MEHKFEKLSQFLLDRMEELPFDLRTDKKLQIDMIKSRVNTLEKESEKERPDTITGHEDGYNTISQTLGKLLFVIMVYSENWGMSFEYCLSKYIDKAWPAHIIDELHRQ